LNKESIVHIVKLGAVLGVALVPLIKSCADDTAVVGKLMKPTNLIKPTINIDDIAVTTVYNRLDGIKRLSEGTSDAIKIPDTDLLGMLPGEKLYYIKMDKPNEIPINTSWFKTAKQPKLVSLFPSTDLEYHNVYGELPSISAKSKIDKFQKKISSDPFLIAKGIDQTDMIFQAIADSDGGPIIILAHSTDSGKKVVFPDGSSMGIVDIHTQCIKSLKRCMVLTCKGDDFNITENITESEALDIWNAISKRPPADKEVLIDDLLTFAKSVRNKQKTKERILISLSFTAATGAPYLKVSSQDEKE